MRSLVVSRAVRLSIEALNRRDYESGFSFFHPDAELVSPTYAVVVAPFPPRVEGLRERIRLEGIWRSEWDDLKYEPQELIDCHDQHDRLLLVGRIRGSGHSSGAPFEMEWADLLTLSQGRVVREQVFFNDRAEALKAVGLEE